MALISLTARSLGLSNITSVTIAFNTDFMQDVMAIQAGNSSLNGNSQFTYKNLDGMTEFWTVTQTVAQIIALAASAVSVTGTTSETFGIDTDATTYVLIKNSTGTLQVRDQTDAGFANFAAKGGLFTLGATDTVTIEAATTDHTGANVLYVDLDANVNNASNYINGIGVLADVTTALGAAESLRGFYADVNGNASDANTSALIGVGAVVTAVIGGRSDVAAVSLITDGSMNTADTISGVKYVTTDTINNASATLYGAWIDFTGVTHTDGIEYGIYIDLNHTITSGSSYGIYQKLNAVSPAIYIDAATVNHTTGNIIDVDLDVDDTSVTIMNYLIDVTSTLNAAQFVKGIYMDIDTMAADVDTSGVYGVDILLSNVSTSAANTVIYKGIMDGTRDTANYSKGLWIIGDAIVINHANAELAGTVVSFATITHTNGTTYGHYTDVSFTAAAGNGYGHYIAVGTNVEAIHIDASTAKHTAGNIINATLDVNSASVNLIYANIDVDTALSNLEVVRGSYFDMDEAVACGNGSFLTGYDVLLTGFTGGAADLTGHKVTFAGTKDQGDSTIGFFCDANLAVNNGSEYLYGFLFDDAGTTETNFAELVGAKFILGAKAQAININAATAQHTGAYIVTSTVLVNAASVSAYHANIDVGTALAPAATVNGILIDIDGNAGDDVGSYMNGIFLTSANTTGGVNTGINIQGTWDYGVDLNAGTFTTDIRLGQGGTIHNTSATLMTFTESTFNFVGNVVINGTGPNYSADSGVAADVYVMTCVPAVTAYVAGQIFIMGPANADNTGGACTLNVNGLGAKSVFTADGANPGAGVIQATTGSSIFVYNGTAMILI